MRDYIGIDTSIHLPIVSADKSTVTDALTLRFGPYSKPSVTIYTGNDAMSADLVRAINGVLAKYQVNKPETGEWFCPRCAETVPGQHVTFDERHDERCGGCGGPVE